MKRNGIWFLYLTMFDQRFKLSWDESISNFSESLPWAMIAFAIAFGTCIIVWIIVYCGDFFIGKPIYGLKDKSYVRKPKNCCNSALRLSVLFFATLIGTAGFWIACTTAGVSFWNLLFGYGIIVAIALNSFGTGLQSIGAYTMIALTNKITEGIYVEFVGMPVEGRISTINLLWVEMEYIDPKDGKFKDIYIPTFMFISSVYLRDYKKERNDEKKDESLPVPTRTKIGLRI